MATHSKRSRRRIASSRSAALTTIPSPEQVRTAAAEIRQGWSPRVRQQRAILARYMMLWQLAAW
jgi:hypothetical protein